MIGILTDKLIMAKSKFIDLCQADGTDKISNFEHRFAVADNLKRAFESQEVKFTDYLNYWNLIKGEFKHPSIVNNMYEVGLNMIDHMIRCAKISAFL